MKQTLSKGLSAGTAVAIALVASLTVAPDSARAQPILGELRSLGFNFCPRGWASAAGQLLPINQNQSLYALLGTTYGGDGRTTFALPDLRGRVAVSQGQDAGRPNFRMGQKGGAEVVTLTADEMPSHSHTAQALNADGNQTSPVGTSFAIGKNLTGGEIAVYSNAAADSQLRANVLTNTGGGQAHENRMPYLATNWCIALQGLFPSRN